MAGEPTPTDHQPLRVGLQRLALQVQAGCAGVIAPSLMMLVLHG